MNYRYIELLGLMDIDANQTVKIDLDMADPISQIVIDHRVTNGIGTDTVGHPIEAITKIEIVDGSDVLFSLDGLEFEALDIYHSGKYPRGGWFNYLPTIPTDRQVAITFGRWLWDPILALDPSKFSNPQLKITFDYDAGGMNPSKCELSVLAAMFDQKAVTPTGFLMTKEIKRWTTVAADHEYTDLPTDYPYRKLLLQDRKDSNPPYWMFGNIKLSEDQDKKVVVNGEFRDLIMGIGRENAFITENWHAAIRAAQNVFDVTPTMNVGAVASGWEEAAAAPDLIVTTFDGDGGHLEANADAAGNATMHVEGWAPHGTLQIPFGLQHEIEDWYDVTKIGSLKLDITDGVSGGTSKIFIQQHRPY